MADANLLQGLPDPNAVDPNAVNPPVDPNAVNPPVDPNAVNPPVDPNAVNPPVDPNAVNPPVDPNAVNPPVDPNAANPNAVDPNAQQARNPPAQNPPQQQPPAQPQVVQVGAQQFVQMFQNGQIVMVPVTPVQKETNEHTRQVGEDSESFNLKRASALVKKNCGTPWAPKPGADIVKLMRSHTATSVTREAQDATRARCLTVTAVPRHSRMFGMFLANTTMTDEGEVGEVPPELNVPAQNATATHKIAAEAGFEALFAMHCILILESSEGHIPTRTASNVYNAWLSVAQNTLTLFKTADVRTSRTAEAIVDSQFAVFIPGLIMLAKEELKQKRPEANPAQRGRALEGRKPLGHGGQRPQQYHQPMQSYPPQRHRPMVCYNCGMQGHAARDCKAPMKK